jgi:hypothetical protein
MGGFYQQHYLPGAPGTGEDSLPSPQEAHPYTNNPTMPMGSSGASMPNPYQNMGYFGGFQDAVTFQPAKPPSARSRRKSAPGLDHVKHRRTRSGR